MNLDKVRYQVTSAISIEFFDDEALIFFAASDHFLTINKTAALLLEILNKKFKENPFSKNDLFPIIRENFHLPERKIDTKIDTAISFMLKHNLLMTLTY